MKYSKKRVRPFPYTKTIIILIIIFLIAYILFFSNLIKKKCGEDQNCFNIMTQKCKASTFYTVKDGNYYKYIIKGSKNNACLINVKLEKMAIGSPVDLINSFEGKDMNCYIPKDRLTNLSLLNMENFLNHCSGPLKESIYELMIKKMYGLIIQNMGDIITEIQKQLYEIK